MNQMISFIVPVYNAEKYVALLLDCLLTQQGTAYEILLIDDGSTDGSGAICKEYAGKNPCIHYFYKENGGVSSARNMGINKASGDWLCFVDSDDLVSRDLVKTCAPCLTEKNDVIFFSIKKFFRDDASDLVENKAPVTVYEGGRDDVLRIVCHNICMKEYLSKTKMNYTNSRGLSAAIFKKSIINERGMRLNTQMRLGEDVTFKVRYLSTCQSVVCISAPMYDYRCTGTSLTHRYNPKIDQEILMILSEFRRSVSQDYHDAPDVLQAFYGAVIVESMWLFILYLNNADCPLSPPEKIKAFQRYKENALIAEGIGKARLEQFVPEHREFYQAFVKQDTRASYQTCCAVIRRNEKREVNDAALKKVLQHLGLYDFLKKARSVLRGHR